MHARTFGAAALTLAAFAISPAYAGADESAAWIRNGVDRYLHQDYEGARDAFARAYDLAPTSRTLFNLALAELQSGHALESVRHMRAYLVELEVEPDKVEALKTKWLPRAEARTSRLVVDAPSGAEIAVDGQPQGNAPLSPIDVTVGDHEVGARSGKWSHAEHVVTRAGEMLTLRLVPEPEAAVTAPVSAAPSSGGGALSGWPVAKRVTLVAFGSGAVVATALGVAFAIVSNDESRAARNLLAQLPPDPTHAQCTHDPLPAQCPALQADNRVARSAYSLSNGFYIGAGALAGAAVVAAVAWPSRRPAETAPAAAHIVPLVGADHWGLGLGGVW